MHIPKKPLALMRKVMLLSLLISLPLERVPSIEILGLTVRIPLVLAGLLILSNIPAAKRALDWPGLRQAAAGFLVACLVSALASPYPARALSVFAFLVFVFLLAEAVASATNEISTEYMSAT